jgi:hypothetical protein
MTQPELIGCPAARPKVRAAIVGALALSAVLGGAACSSDSTPNTADTPDTRGESVAAVGDADLQMNQRLAALEQVWEGAASGADGVGLEAARSASKDLIWKGSAPTPLRQKALALLLTDTSEAGLADTRRMLALRMPTEGSWAVLVDMCRAVRDRASDPAWRSLTASLVRSYARKVPVPPDPDRPEREALLALYPERELEATVYDVFVRPAENGAPERPDDSAQKSRQAAWDLLGRLDPDGRKRTALIASDARGAAEPVLKDLSRAARELGVTPITGSELAWLGDLLNSRDAKAGPWWSQAAAAVASLSPEQRSGLAMRHLEAVRFAATARPDWLGSAGSSREQLLSQLASRLGSGDDRRVWLREVGGEGGTTSRERLSDFADRLAWADLVTILTIDDALRDARIVADLFAQADADRADESTEYGGVLFVKDQAPTPLRPDTGAGDVFLVRGFSPRPAQRVNDRTFVASAEMFTQSARGLAHYHFHVQSPRNGEYAGPGRGDADYAQLHGRACLVLTSVREGVMNVDYYHRDQVDGGLVVIDLGEIRR